MTTDVQQRLHKTKVFTIDTVTNLLKCSIRTAWRRMHEWNACASYNHNAKYHTFPTIPQFDDNGIWRHNDICFSRYGNLTQTITHIVGESQEGIDAPRLCSILGVSANSLYTHFRGIQEIVPQRMGRTLVFFSSQSDIRTRQMAQRTHLTSTERSVMPRSTDAVIILVDRIKHPDDSIEQCARRLQTHHSAITPEAIRTLLAKYGIVKKTADMR
jgi:hypothetical protein